MELSHGAGGGDGRAANAGEVVAVAVHDAFDQAEGSQATELTGQLRGAGCGHERCDVGSAHAVDIEFGALQCAQQPLLRALEEIQSLDGALTIRS